ncbi:MAG: iron-sulfur cluster repair di-iron protein [Thermoanaerobaculaceae bacterium]|nr:iron-sulfur cluster repair di-iron protein [Thermoanaerobaculaceae bacterium]
MEEREVPVAKDTLEKTVGEFVAEDYRTARVFEKYGIDFCCGGKAPLAETCRQKGIGEDAIVREIEAAKNAPVERDRDYAAWTLSFLADYIVNTHHAYLNENMGPIAGYAHKIAEVHGANHPEVIEIAGIFDRIAADMAAHLREEEEVLFPAVRRIDAARRTGAPPEPNDLESVRTCVATLGHEHEEIGDAVHRIRHLSKEYAIPDDVCNTFVLTYRKLEEFEDDLHKHVHLENNILFPKAARP